VLDHTDERTANSTNFSLRLKTIFSLDNIQLTPRSTVLQHLSVRQPVKKFPHFVEEGISLQRSVSTLPNYTIISNAAVGKTI
jgi:hypothetical protein